MNCYQIFICSYPQAELYSIGLQYNMEPEPNNFRLRGGHANYYTNNTNAVNNGQSSDMCDHFYYISFFENWNIGNV